MVNGLTRPINYLTHLMWWWLTHSLKVDALQITYGGVSQVVVVVFVVVVVALLTCERWHLIISGASGELAHSLNMGVYVSQLITIRRRG